MSPRTVDILIVDDRPEDARLLAEVLAAPGYRITTASSGPEALRHVLGTDHAAILLDIVMPRMDGFEVAALIKERARSRDTPIIFLTAAGDDIAVIYRAYSVGAVDYLVKPFDESVVRAKVSIFAEMFRKDLRIREQAQALREADRRERELQLSELRLLSERRYRSLLEMIPASVWTADPDGTVTYCNHRWREQTGLRLEQTRREGWLGVVHPEDRERVALRWAEALRDRRGWETELRLRGSDGRSRWHMAQVIPDGGRARGRQRGWVAMFADCEELKATVEARDQFLSIASHELRTPLSTLMLQLEALQRALHAPGLAERESGRLESALRQTRRLDKLVADLLDVSRICTGRLQLERERVDLVDLTRACIDRFSEAAARANSGIALHASGPVLGSWDRSRIEQVITNLLSNALKYGAGEPIEVTVEGADQGARLVVRDRGIGIPPESQARIFERFERAVSVRNYGGLGLGLFISKQILDAHGGAIEVVSRPGEGATFLVTLPLSADRAASQDGASCDAPPRGLASDEATPRDDLHAAPGGAP